MATLAETLTTPPKRESVVADCLTLIDSEVDSKSGISGFAIKAGYKIVKGLKPGFIREVVVALLPDFSNRLQPIADEAKAKGLTLNRHFDANRGRVADALLGITDDRAARSTHSTVKGAYEKLRPTAKKHVEEAAPKVGTIIDRYWT